MQKGKSSISWREKLEKKIQPKLVNLSLNWSKKIGAGKMLIPTPLLIDSTIKKIPKGKVVTVNNIRDYLANEYNADTTCPLTTGIFLNIAANTAEEDRSRGKTRVTPYWRVLKEGGKLNPKFPGGISKQADYLEQEGLEIITGNGKDQYQVKNYEKKLVTLE